MQALDASLLESTRGHFEAPLAQPGLLWGLFTPRQASPDATASHTALGSTANAATARGKGVRALLAKMPWITGIAYLDEEVEKEQHSWEEYENELASLLGIEGGSAVVRVRFPPVGTPGRRRYLYNLSSRRCRSSEIALMARHVRSL